MITFNELLHGNLISDVPLEHQHNLESLLVKINKVREAWQKPMIVTSGYRTMAEHQAIYDRKWIQNGRQGPRPIAPPHSAHLTGNAVDISDPDGSMYKWLQDNQSILIANDLWCESGTVGWCHYQGIPSKSGHRFFIP